MTFKTNFPVKNLKRIIFAACMAAALLALLSGCSIGSVDTSGEVTHTVTSKSDLSRLKFSEPNNIIPGAPDIYVILKSYNTTYWKPLADGVSRAGIDCGCNIYMSTGLNYIKWDGQKKLLEKALSDGADAVILAPEDSSELNESIDKLHEAGIPVILVDTCVNVDSYDVCYMTDNLKAGQNAARELYTMMKAGGVSEYEVVTVSLIVGNSESQTVNERLAGFLSYWNEHAPKAWMTSDEIEVVNEEEKFAAETAGALLQNDPNIRAFFAADEASGAGVTRMMLDGERKDLYLACFDYSPTIKTIISDPDYNVISILQNQYNMGYEGVETAKSLVYGGKATAKFVDTDTLTLRYSNITEGNNLQEIAQYKDFK